MDTPTPEVPVAVPPNPVTPGDLELARKFLALEIAYTQAKYALLVATGLIPATEGK